MRQPHAESIATPIMQFHVNRYTARPAKAKTEPTRHRIENPPQEINLCTVKH